MCQNERRIARGTARGGRSSGWHDMIMSSTGLRIARRCLHTGRVQAELSRTAVCPPDTFIKQL